MLANSISWFLHVKAGFVGGYERVLLLMAVCISLLLTGPERMSIEWIY